MLSHRFKRFYFVILPRIFFIVGVLLLLLSVGPLLRAELWFRLKEFKSQEYVLDASAHSSVSVFAKYISTRPVSLAPVNKDFALVIEKIGLSVPIQADISVTDESAYKDALKHGVAHARTSSYPSEEPGNVYLFAHASLNFWELGSYATSFNLLRKLSIGDRVHIFYKDRMFVYSIVNKETLKGWNTYPLTRPVIEPTLTLQTCTPPGTTLNRLVVTAILLEAQ